MKLRPHGFFPYILSIALAIVASTFASYAQSVSISNTNGATQESPATFTVTATPSGGSFTKVVFYRNDVPFFTDTTSTYDLSQSSVGQETYTYRARAYTSATAYVESSTITVTVTTKQANILRVGEPVPTPTPGGPSPTPTPTPVGPDRLTDHTSHIRHALQYLADHGGGTLFFPCTSGTWYGGPDISIYNISDTLVIPSNVTLQGESAESPEGRCRVYWRDPTWNPDDDPEVDPTEDHCYNNQDPEVNPGLDLLNKPMFQINGGTSGVRFRDLFIYSRTSGPNCHTRQDWDRIEGEGTVAIALYGFTGDIKDFILENVSIASFTYGVKATTCEPEEEGCTESDYGIFDVRLRAFRPGGNFRALSIDSPEAHDWDVQNMNVAIGPDQGGVEIIEAGRPSGYSGENGRLKFLQVNCAGVQRLSAFCVEVKKHSGLFFRQLFHEGTTRAMHVRDIDPGSNSEPIVLENSLATGMFYDDSMKLYLVGSGIMSSPEYAPATEDNGRLEFFEDGLNATIVDCGDYHVDRTDTLVGSGGPPAWEDWRMMGTHSERNRRSFYAPLTNYTIEVPRKVCPEGVGGSVPNTSAIGGDHFDTGVLPVEPAVYTAAQIFDSGDCGGDSDCANEFQTFLNSIYDGRTLVVYGNVPVKSTVIVKSGRQIAGIPGLQNAAPQITFTPGSGVTHLFEIQANAGVRTSNVTVRNLKLLKSGEASDITGIKILGDDVTSPLGEATDVHMSGLTIESFATGMYAGIQTGYGNPMLDGMSFKNLSFVNNSTEAVRIDSQNASNWNVMNLSMQSNTSNDEGWDQKYGGGYVFQNVTCSGTSSNDMKDCVGFEMASGIYITNLKKTSYVTNVVTINQPPYTYGEDPYDAWPISQLFIRNSDLRTESTSPARYSVNLQGKAFIVSMNNKYDHFTAGSGEEQDFTSVTSCGDIDEGGGSLYPDLNVNGYPNNYVGLNTPGLIVCAATNPYKWDSPVRWGVETDTRMVANIYDDTQEDFISFRPSTNVWYIRQQQGPGVIEKSWGTSGDIPVVGRFFTATQRSQIAIFRPSTGAWWMWDFVSNSSGVPVFGSSGDIPIVGNFFKETGGASAQRDEIAVYRDSVDTFYILDPRTSVWEYHAGPSTAASSDLYVGDFLNLGYDQVAHWQGNGTWYVYNLENGGSPTTLTFGTSGDVPVVGEYFPADSNGSCTQLGVWRSSVQKFLVEDGVASCGGGTKRDGEVEWGLAYGSGTSDDDLPIAVKNASGLAQPTAIRRINADPTFQYFVTENYWWVHAPIVP